MISVSTPHQGFICIHLFDTHLTQSLVAVPFPLSLTTKALYSSSRGRFVTNSFQSITRDLLSSLEQLRTTSLFSWHTNVTLFTVSCMHLLAVHFSDTTAIASISNKNSGFAKPETKSTVTSGGFGRFPQTC